MFGSKTLFLRLLIQEFLRKVPYTSLKKKKKIVLLSPKNSSSVTSSVCQALGESHINHKIHLLKVNHRPALYPGKNRFYFSLTKAHFVRVGGSLVSWRGI